MEQNYLILSLLKAELRNNKLINGLNEAGALIENFNTDLSTDILKLLDFNDDQRDDLLYQLYFQTLDRLCKKELSYFLNNLNALSLELYNELLLEKIRRQEEKNSLVVGL